MLKRELRWRRGDRDGFRARGVGMPP